MKYSLKTQVKMWKSEVKWFFVKHRFVKSYDAKKRILAAFLIVVNVFIGWNASLSMPEIEFGIKWESEPMTFVNPALASAKPVSEEADKPVEISDCNTAVDVMAPKYGASKDLLKRIVKAESGNKNTAANPDSTARGCFQFIIGTWESYGRELWGEKFYEKNRYSPADNVELAAWMIGELGEISHWDASRHLWSTK